MSMPQSEEAGQGAAPDQDEDFFRLIKDLRVAIMGLGLMGGSLAMALRGRVRELLGSDPNQETLDLADKIALCNRISTDPAEILPNADLVILAAPVKAILELLHNLPDNCPGPAIVLDLGSTKTRIVEAMEILPERFDPIGGHPMCGKERSSLVEAESGLYRGASFALTPLPRTSLRARTIIENLVRAVGAHPVWLNAWMHDRWVSATSHAPFLIANALAGVTPPEVAPLVGPGYRSTTRISTTPPSVMLDILSTNRDNVLESLGRFRKQIDLLETLLREENLPALEVALNSAVIRQKQLLLTADG